MARNDAPASVRTKPPSEEAVAIGRALKVLRERQGHTQSSAAEAAGITKTAWQNYENGRAIVLRTDVQQRLAKALDSDRSELLKILSALTPSAERNQLSTLGVAEPSHAFDDAQVKRAVYPLREGDVTITFPADLSAESLDQLEQYLTLFIRARRPANDLG